MQLASPRDRAITRYAEIAAINAYYNKTNDPAKKEALKQEAIDALTATGGPLKGNEVQLVILYTLMSGPTLKKASETRTEEEFRKYIEDEWETSGVLKEQEVIGA